MLGGMAIYLEIVLYSFPVLFWTNEIYSNHLSIY